MEKRRIVSSGGYDRSSNLELYRIIVMLLIVAHHYVVNSGLTDVGGVIYSDPLKAKALFALILGAWGKAGINCFVLITGYFMCRSEITARKFVRLFAEIMFYSGVFYCIFLFSGYEPFSLKILAKAIVPIYSVTTGFSGCFLLFYLCIPFLNILVAHITERQHVRLLLLLCFIYVFFGTVPKLKVNMNYVSWFCVLYLIASYIRLYPKKIFSNVMFWRTMTIASVLLSIASVIGCAWVGSRIGRNNAYYFVSDSNTVLAVMTGVSSFMFFKNLCIKKNRFINTVAASTFGVLLIHANSDTMRRWLWKDVLNNVGTYGTDLFALHAVGSVITVYVVCTMIDMVRVRLVEQPFLKWWDSHWKGICDKYRMFENKLYEKHSNRKELNV